MLFHKPVVLVAVVPVVGLLCSGASGQVTIPTVAIGSPGNAADPLTGFGSVPYGYDIGRTEVTNAQYAAFLNAVAASDTNDLYSPNMSGPFGGITRSGSPGSYTYATISGRADNPVNVVTFWSAARFANWLHNGQPAGQQDNTTTESGAYELTAGGISSNSVTRRTGWRWAIAGENEWYKAAYHQPAGQGGDADNYWLYPTSSNAVPTAAHVNFAGSGLGNVAPVGSYSANFYGTFDMGGNVYEWTDTITSVTNRAVRGGSFASSEFQLRSTFRDFIGTPDGVGANLGFRVVAIPGPSAVAVAAVAGMMALRRRRFILDG